jgi:hypothetical protein
MLLLLLLASPVPASGGRSRESSLQLLLMLLPPPPPPTNARRRGNDFATAAPAASLSEIPSRTPPAEHDGRSRPSSKPPPVAGIVAAGTVIIGLHKPSCRIARAVGRLVGPMCVYSNRAGHSRPWPPEMPFDREAFRVRRTRPIFTFWEILYRILGARITFNEQRPLLFKTSEMR